MMIHFTIHCHPVPISRLSPLSGELDDLFPYQPKTRTEPEPILSEQENVLEHLNQIRENLAKQITTQKPNPITPRKDVSSLNRCDVDEVKQSNYLLAESQQRQIQSIRRKTQLLPQRYSDPIYLPQSQMLLLSPGWPSADRYSCCSVPSPVNPSAQCRLHRFCPYCCYQLGHDVQLQFVPSFYDGTWFFMTGSFCGSLGLGKSSDSYDWVLHWDIYQSALNNLIKSQFIRGYYLVEELAVNNIYQVSVLPHIHAIIDSDSLGEEMVLDSVNNIKASPGPNLERLLEPDVVVEPITTQRDLMDRIRYLFKPINLVKAYQNDWRTECDASPQNQCTLNSHTTDLVLGYSLVNRRRTRMRAKGTLNCKCKQHIGKARSERSRYKPLLKQLQSQSWEGEDCDVDVDLN